MSYVYGNKFDQGFNWKTYKRYVGARFARVYPLNLITMLIALGMALYIRSIADGLDPFFDDMLNPWAAPASAVFLQGMHLFQAAPLNTPSWSLSTEWWMYMIFPLLVPWFFSLKPTGKVVALLLIIAGFFGLMYIIGPLAGPIYGQYTINSVADFGFLRCALGFLLGMWVHEIFKVKIGYNFFGKDYSFSLFFLLILACMHFEVNSLIIVGLFALLILSATYNNGIVKNILDTKPLQVLGDWSFSIYMVHVLIIYLFWILGIQQNPTMFADFKVLLQQEPNYEAGLVGLFILLPLTFLFSWLMYRFVEIPSRNYLNKVFKTKTE